MTPIEAPHPAPEDSLNQVFRTLSYPVRRQMLIELLVQNTINVNEIANGTSDLDTEESESIKIDLYHHHLPALDDSHFIDWDDVTDTIMEGPRFEQIRPILRLLDAYQDELPGDWP